MAEIIENKSVFIDHQDKNGDGLNDHCDDLINVAEGKKCPSCVPNPNYVAPNWREKTDLEPWFNEKFCKYQVTMQTDVSNILGVDVDEIFQRYANDAAEALLLSFEKAIKEESIQTIVDNFEFQKYDLDPRPISFLKLLYSVPYDVFVALPSANEEDDDEEDEEDTSDVEAEFKASDIKPKMIRLRKALNLYARYYRVYQALDGGNLVFIETNSIFSIKQLDRYGDLGLFPNSVMASVLNDLNAFLNSKGMNIFGVGKISFGRDRVMKMKLFWTHEMKLKKLMLWTVGCGNKPTIIKGKRLSPLVKTESFRDPTAMGYFAKLNEIDQMLNAREEQPWLDFMTKFTYPKIVETFNWPAEQSEGGETALSCLGDALAKESKQLGQDIVDDIFGIGDAIAYKFHKNICAKSNDEEVENQVRMGLRMDPNGPQDPLTGKRAPGDLSAMAAQQALNRLEADEQVFVQLCTRLMPMANLGSGFSCLNPAASPQDQTQEFMDILWREGFDRIKICGLFELLMDTAGCLMGGLSLEEALASIVKAALKSMNLDNLSDFFVGLPPEKQAELDALVQRKIESGDIFKDAGGAATGEGNVGGNATMSDAISGKLTYSKPGDWRKSADTRDDQSASANGVPAAPPSTPATNGQANQDTSSSSRRTLAQQFDVREKGPNQLSNNIVIEAYIEALIEHYSDDLLSIVDMLNKYPGAQLISKMIIALDCPRPPMFNPNFMDFIKDLELPWCRSQGNITFPKLVNPFGWIPKLTDISRIIWEAFICAIQSAIMSIIMRIMIKVCELIGSAICKALETVGSLAASLPAVATGRTTFSDVIKESICGEDASEEQVNDTIAEMFEKLGVGGAALNDKDSVLNLAEDMASALSRQEMMSAFLGEMSPQAAKVIKNIIDYEYPQFSDAFPTQNSIADFMGNVGNIMPAEVKDAMRDFNSQLPENDFMPANPTLCATQEQLDDFADLRCTLLEGRASPEQCRTMFDNLQKDLKDDLEDIATLMNDPNPFKLPPLISSPGCDDGLLPFETPAQQQATNLTLGLGLKALKKDFVEDMLGNGGLFGGQSGWGMVNMIMSDTMGKPLTAHWRKSSFLPSYVDFISEGEVPDEDNFLFFFSDPSPTRQQRGNFPFSVAPWLRSEMRDLDATFNYNNELIRYKSSLQRATQVGLGENDSISLINLPDLGYNMTLTAESVSGESAIRIKPEARKRTPDVELAFKDNNNGDEGFLYGFNVAAYFTDLEAETTNSGELVTGTVPSNVGSFLQPRDVTRIKIDEIINSGGNIDKRLRKTMDRKQWKEFKAAQEGKEDVIITEQLFEFVGVANTFENFDPTTYPTFASCFEEKNNYSPQVVLLREILTNNPNNDNVPSLLQLQDYCNNIMGKALENMATEVANNDFAFTYGAKYDTLVEEDAEYVVRSGQTLSPGGTLYGDAEVSDGEGGTRKIKNADMIMGVSRDQFLRGDENARVFYLNPMTYGGSYTSPAMYIKPLENKGWLGFIDVLFPDYNPCKPRDTDLVDFDEIQKEVSKANNSIPIDPRLQSDPDCVEELPYNRILERTSTSGIQGLIRAACRIYGTVHFIKALATFTTFKPDFKNVFNSLFASYVVEHMEKSFKDAQAAGWELFNTFKDSEFWYAFLEQSVQTYSRLMDNGEIIDPPQSVIDAMIRINDAIELYRYPIITNYVNSVEDANLAGETDAPYRWPLRSYGLKQYRSEKNFEAVQATEEDAKIVLKEWVLQELNVMGKKLIDNLKSMNVEPVYNNLDYYVLTQMTLGNTLDLDKELVEEPVGLPSEGENHYTAGGELSKSDGTEYAGYYHVHTDEDNNVIYMEGEFHTQEQHEELNPFANKMIVPIGDIDEYNSGKSYVTTKSTPFVIQKYISIDGKKYQPTSAIELIKRHTEADDLNISDVYPGTLEKVTNDSGQVTGLTGELGVRYGVTFSIQYSTTRYEIASAEIDAIDTRLSQIAPLESNSKLLLCLVNSLVDSEEFKYISRYVLPIDKAASILAIYNDMGFLPSIGQQTVDDGETKPTFDSAIDEPSFESKPGTKVTFPNSDSGDWTPDYSNSNDEWASAGDRVEYNPFLLTWDEWDQVLLRNSKSRIKKQFKRFYNNRDFDPGDPDFGQENFIAMFAANLKASLKPASGQRILPWFKKRKLRNNPFNNKGELCKKND